MNVGCPTKTKSYGNKKRWTEIKKKTNIAECVCGEEGELEKPSNRACLK